jgi:hypothetical protein
MRVFIAFFLIFGATTARCQHRDDWSNPFDEMLDSIVIHAQKISNSVTITTIPYNGEWVLPENPEQGTMADLVWTEMKKDGDQYPIGRVSYTWTYLNDSMVCEVQDDEKYYGIIRGSKIEECQKNGKPIVHSWYKSSKRDSVGFTIIEGRWMGKGGLVLKYNKFICDSSGRVIESYRYASGYLTRYTTTQYFGDTARLTKAYIKPVDSSIVYESTSGANATTNSPYYVQNTIHVTEWIKPQNDSLALMNESYHCSSINQNRTIKTTTGWEKNYNIYNTNPNVPSISTTTSEGTTLFTYDQRGRILKAIEIYKTTGFNFKNEMIITYNEKGNR